jgi:hypothetical protein
MFSASEKDHSYRPQGLKFIRFQWFSVENVKQQHHLYSYYGSLLHIN